MEGNRPLKNELPNRADNDQNEEEDSDELLLVRLSRGKRLCSIRDKINQTVKARRKKPKQQRQKSSAQNSTIPEIPLYPEVPLQVPPEVPVGQPQLWLPSGVQIKQEPLPVVQPFSLFYSEETSPQRRREGRKDTIETTQVCPADGVNKEIKVMETAGDLVTVKEELLQEQETGEFEAATTGPEGGEIAAGTTGPVWDNMEGNRPLKNELPNNAENDQNEEEDSDEPLLVRLSRRKRLCSTPDQINQTVKARRKKPKQQRQKSSAQKSTIPEIPLYPEVPLQVPPEIPVGQPQLWLPSRVQIKQEPGEEIQPEPLPVVQPFSLFYSEETSPQRQRESRKDTVATTQVCPADGVDKEIKVMETAGDLVTVKEELLQEQETGEFEAATTGPEGVLRCSCDVLRHCNRLSSKLLCCVNNNSVDVLRLRRQNEEEDSDEPLLVRLSRRKRFCSTPDQINQTVKAHRKKPKQQRQKSSAQNSTIPEIPLYPEVPLQVPPEIPVGQPQLLLPSGVQIKQELGEEIQPEPLPVVQPFSLFFSQETSPQRRREGRKNVDAEAEGEEEEEQEEEGCPIDDDPSLYVSSADKRPREYTIKEYCDMYLAYGQCHSSGQSAARWYACLYPNRRRPTPALFHSLDRRLREYGQVGPMYSNISGRCLKDIIEEDEDECEIWDLIMEDPRRSAHLHEPYSRYEDLHPYHYIKRQKLSLNDRSKRMKFCRWLLHQHQKDTTFLDFILWNSEALFSRKGIFNYERAQYWTVEYPNSILKQSINERKGSNLWIGIIQGYILGPYSLPDNLTLEYYNYFVTTILPRLMEDLPLKIRSRVCFQMVKNPTHRLKDVREVLPTIFPGGWLGKDNSVAWPPRSTDLNPVEFFLWNYLKNVVYNKLYNTVEDLITSVYSGIASVTEDMLQQVRKSVIRRAEACIMADGGYFESFL